jgi:cellulose synthase/poly-beta-1,6-N-acetylglucosamine synthase-like glycosyltransferase
MALSALLGFRVGWCPGAISYDQKVSSLSQLSAQRHRWLAGDFEAVSRYFSRLLYGGIRDKDPHKIEQALYLARMLVPRNLLVAGSALLLGISLTERCGALCVSPWVWATVFGAHLLSFGAGLRVQQSSWRTCAALLLSPLFVLVYLRAALRVIRGAPIQVKTEHDTAALDSMQLLE